MRHLCPYCGNPCLSSLQKAALSSLNSKDCNHCGKPVSTPQALLVAQLVVLVVCLVAAKALAPGPIAILAAGVPVAALLLFIQLKYVPLVKSGYSPDDE